MKSRAIALGASVIALTVAGSGNALAAGLDGLGQVKAETETSVSAPGASAEVEGNVKVPVTVPSKGSVEELERAPGRPSATVEIEQRSGKDRSEAVLELDKHGVSAYVDQRRKGEFELEAEGQAGSRHAESTVSGYSRRAGEVKAHGRAHGPKVKQAGIERSIRKHSKATRQELPATRRGGDDKRTPLEAIGREVGNPIQLSAAGWMLALAAFGGFAAPRLVRRLVRTS